MSPVTQSKAQIAAVDESGASTVGGDSFAKIVDARSLSQETRDKRNRARNHMETQPFRRYIARTIKRSGVPDALITRQLASNICGMVASLPWLPDKKEKVEGNQTEYDVQINSLAQAAQEAQQRQTGQAVVMIVPARKLARAALDLRLEDPDGSKGLSHVTKEPRIISDDERGLTDLGFEEDLDDPEDVDEDGPDPEVA